jgi:hypothetical protein
MDRQYKELQCCVYLVYAIERRYGNVVDGGCHGRFLTDDPSHGLVSRVAVIFIQEKLTIRICHVSQTLKVTKKWLKGKLSLMNSFAALRKNNQITVNDSSFVRSYTHAMKLCAVAVSAFTVVSTTVITTTEATFQSPPRGATYAASMVAGPDFIYYTGITYDAITQKTHCFLATSDKEPTDFLQFEIFGGTTEATATGDSCRAVAVLGQQDVAVVGTADPDGYFGFANSTEKARGLPQLGFGMTVTADSLQPIKGATLSSFARVPYPQAVVGDPNDPNIMYVASMVSNQDTYNSPQEEFPNWSRLFQHGSTFALTVEAFYPSEDVVVDAWTKYFPVDDMDDTEDILSSVHVGGMINKPVWA